MANIIECPLTGFEVSYTNAISGDAIFYHLKILEIEIRVLWCYDCYREIKNKNILEHHIVKGLIVNGLLPEAIFLCTNDCSLKIPENYEKLIFPDFLETISYPKNASEKMDNLLLYFYKKQEFDGGPIFISPYQTIDKNDEIILLNYFKNKEELFFYIRSLAKINLIENIQDTAIKLTHEGLNRIVEIEKSSVISNKCFIAMAFDKSTTIYREAIKKALENNKFKAVIIDEEHLDSDKTIPDEILNKIRKAKFCVADFTLHRNGVYFESGYALGLGKQVIYTCKEDDFKNAHFDIKQLQHVLYNTPDELEKKLTNKIEFWIR